jgi:hypothetical protein
LVGAVVALFFVTLIAGVSSAQPGGPDATQDFSLFFTDQDGTLDETGFDVSDGWDGGSRIGYQCAWVEYFQAGTELFEVHYEVVAGYPALLNDRYMDDGQDGSNTALCGDGPPHGEAVYDGSDHFPHGTELVFFDQGMEIVRLDYHRDHCAQGYWTPGDEPGEAWLWWDADGPEHTEPGVPVPDHCEVTGPEEPQPVARAWVQNLAPGVSVCTTDHLSGEMCDGMSEPPPTEPPPTEPPPTEPPPTEPPPTEPGSYESGVGLKLKGHLKASGTVTSEEPALCVAGRTVVVERRANGQWVTAGKDQTTVFGKYSVRLADRAGTYRARVKQMSLLAGDLCESAVSKRKVYD